MSEITMPPPKMTQVALTISDGQRFSTTYVDRGLLESDPAGAISAAMKTLDDGMTAGAQNEIRGWSEPDVIRTKRGYALSALILEESLRSAVWDDQEESRLCCGP